MRPVPRIPAYAFRANASGRLINKPTIAPASAGCTRNETLAANKPIAKRLEGLQEHSGRSVRMVSEDGHQHVDHAECNAAEYSEDNSTHGQACTLLMSHAASRHHQ